MYIDETFAAGSLPASFAWFNPPAEYATGNGLEIVTKAQTDFWQGTHYGFRRDDGHCLLTPVDHDFTAVTHVTFMPQSRFDQCGLMVRIDAENWIKVATELENEAISRLGSVVTNLGYSDWASQDISAQQREMWYRISRNGADFLIEYGQDGQSWQQMRVAHLHAPFSQVQVGVYACSPTGAGFRCRFLRFQLGPDQWDGHGDEAAA